jgi:hypothetical protein
MTTLKNTDSRPIVATLYHEVVCAAEGKCGCKVRRTTGPNGKPLSARIPRTLRINAGQTVTVHSSAKRIGTIARALEAGRLVEINKPVAKPAPKAAPKTKTKAALEGGAK